MYLLFVLTLLYVLVLYPPIRAKVLKNKDLTPCNTK